MRMFVSAGVGDFLAIESWMTQEEKDSVTELWVSTPAAYDLQDLFPICFLHLITVLEKPVYNGGIVRTFESLDAYKALMPTEVVPNDVMDASIAVFAEHIRWTNRVPQRSSIADKQVADISSFALPEKFVVIHPCSTKTLTPLRDLTHEEWITTIQWLERNDLMGVVLNNAGAPADISQRHQRILDLTGKTTLLQSFEIMKRGQGFVGASSCLSVVAAKLYPRNMIFIKGHDRLCTYWTWFYYSPHTMFKIEKSLTLSN